jgi:hypothetical protein
MRWILPITSHARKTELTKEGLEAEIAADFAAERAERDDEWTRSLPGLQSNGEQGGWQVIAGSARVGSDPRLPFERARRAVGTVKINQLAWLIKFTEGSREKMKADLARGEASTLAHQFAWFAEGCFANVWAVASDPDAIIAAADRAQEGLHRFARDDDWEIEMPAGLVYRLHKDQPVEVSGDPTTAFFFRVTGILEAEGSRLSFCREHHCRKVFFKRKRARYCEDHRGSAEYTRRWRRKLSSTELSERRARHYSNRKAKEQKRSAAVIIESRKRRSLRKRKQK